MVFKVRSHTCDFDWRRLDFLSTLTPDCDGTGHGLQKNVTLISF